ncbi:hypothetical protein ABFY27_09945 [Akkermansia massiliensis]
MGACSVHFNGARSLEAAGEDAGGIVQVKRAAVQIDGAVPGQSPALSVPSTVVEAPFRRASVVSSLMEPPSAREKAFPVPLTVNVPVPVTAAASAVEERTVSSEFCRG